MIFQEISAVYSENYTKHIHKQITKMLGLLLLKQVSHTQPCVGVKN